MLRIIDLAPLYLEFRLRTLRNVSLEHRQELLRRIEGHDFSPIRNVLYAVKMFIVFPFFSQEEAERAIGYERPEVRA